MLRQALVQRHKNIQVIRAQIKLLLKAAHAFALAHALHPHLLRILHNAGMLGDRVELAHYPIDVWDDVLSVNLRAPFALTQALLPLLQKSAHASVVFTSSSVGREPRALWGAYSVSKVATEAMSKIFAAENSYPNIRFNCINPGGTRTAMRAKAYPDEDPKVLPTADEIMPAYLYLMGDDSLDMNGQSIDAQA